MKETLSIGDKEGTFNGVPLLDEMAIQKDLQIKKKGKDWQIFGAVDLGPLVNDLEELSGKRDDMGVATHYFQYIYVAFNGFHWPVAYYGCNNVNGHLIYLTFWPLVDILSTYGFKIHGSLMDGSCNNHQFSHIVIKPENARILKYIAENPYDTKQPITIVQDCKYALKKIQNSIFSSCHSPNAK